MYVHEGIYYYLKSKCSIQIVQSVKRWKSLSDSWLLTICFEKDVIILLSTSRKHVYEKKLYNFYRNIPNATYQDWHISNEKLVPRPAWPKYQDSDAPIIYTEMAILNVSSPFWPQQNRPRIHRVRQRQTTRRARTTSPTTSPTGSKWKGVDSYRVPGASIFIMHVALKNMKE